MADIAPNTFSVGAQPGLSPGGEYPQTPDPGNPVGLAKPSPYQNEARLIDLFNQLKRESTEYRWIWEREWLRDLFYVANRQWISFHPSRREWVDKRLQKWVPRPVTNKIAEILQAIRTTLISVNLQVKATPVGNDTESIAAAEVADQIAPLIHEEHIMNQVMREADFWFIATGNACLQVSWDKDNRFNRVFVPNEQCSLCGTVASPKDIVDAGHHCPACSSPFLQKAQNPDGSPAGEWVSFGRGKTTALSPFEYAFPSNITRWDELPYIIRLRWRDKHWIEANHPELTGKIVWEKSPSDRSLQIFKSLALTNDVGTGSQFAYLGTAGAHTVEGVTEYELWMRPTPEFPNGLLLRILGDKNPVVMQAPEESIPGPLPYKDIEGNPIFPFFHAQYEHMGGRLYGRSALSPLIQKQDQINQLDSLIQLIIQRTANPAWVIPENAGIENITGEPGLIIKWNVLAAQGQGKPERIAGENIPPSLFSLREQYLKDMEELSGAFDIIKGQKPTGVEAFSALQLLVERSQSRFTAAFQARGEMYRHWYSCALELERQFGPQQRVWAVVGPNRGYTFKHFQNAQLQGQVAIMVEDGSNMPKTALGERAAVEQANQLQLLDPADPDQKRVLLTKFGLQDLIPSLDAHVQAALQIQDEFEDWANNPQGPPPLVIKPWFNLQVHLNERIKWLNSDHMREILKAQPGLEPIIGQHLAAIQMMLQPPEMVQPQGPSGPEGHKQTPGGQAMTNSNKAGGTGSVPRGNQPRPNSGQQMGPA